MTTPIAHSGTWIIAIIMIVVASWVFYRYFAPKTWHEWAGAGLVQAFITALYAEMYGFPLTIYLLIRFFGLDRTTLNANLWSTLLGMGETGMLIAMIIGYALLFIGIGLFSEGWRELYRAYKEHRLATDGLYGLVRHPQYTGLFLGLFGEGVVHWPTIFSVALFPIIVIAYTVLAYREEKRMLLQFGEQYRTYKEHTPMFFPGKSQWRKFVKFSQMDGDKNSQQLNHE